MPAAQINIALKPEAQLLRAELDSLTTTAEARISDVKPLSSYNWIEKPTPTVAIPGCPALWSPPDKERKLEPDSGRVYIAQNAARHPTSPLEPLFRAVYTTNPSFDLSQVDIVSDRNNIRKLYAFVNPSSQKYSREPFTIGVEVVGDTVIFCRQETAVVQVIKPGEFFGYGHEFEKNYTKEQVQGSTGHHRIISYRFCDLSLVIRSETDGYVDDQTQNDDQLNQVMDSLSLHSKNIKHKGSKLTLQQKGRTTPLDSTLEIKTRTAKKPLRTAEVATQLWISQTPKLVRAYHTGGVFPKPEVEDMTAAIKRWETTNQDSIKKLGALLRWIVAGAKKCPGGRACIKYENDSGHLLLFRSSAKRMLPDDLYTKWEKIGKEGD
ncbi:hypothetical protein K4F52_004288 [Lecanicillium sp. MT-2017a]|nr:hypothetical protein K4F52_004288 [Lecanicillium sp. MT-2017a]